MCLSLECESTIMSYRSYSCKGTVADVKDVKEIAVMTELIADANRNEVPRLGRADRTSLMVVWPDVQPSLQSRLVDRLVLLTGRRKWWASAAVVQARARSLARRPASHRPPRLGRNVQIELCFAEGWPV